MNITNSLLGLALVIPLTTALAAEAPPSRPPPDQAIVYKPPLRGAPKTRVGGASRGRTDQLTLSALVPDHTGLTVSEQPTLHWYVSKAVPLPQAFTLLDEQSIKPLLEIQLPTSRQPGVQELRLSQHNIQLQPGIEYEWRIALVQDPEYRAGDIIAGGTIQRVSPPQPLQTALQQAIQADLPALYAAEGIWYDAIAALSELIDANPTDRRLREQRAALLEQVGLAAAADYDRHFFNASPGKSREP